MLFKTKFSVSLVNFMLFGLFASSIVYYFACVSIFIYELKM